MTNFGSMVWPILTLILSNKLGFSATQITLYMLIFTIVCIPITFLGGKLADKYNKRNIIVICDLISIIGYIMCAFIPLTIGSVIIVSISAIFQQIEYSSYETLVADFTTTKDRERGYSLSYLGSNLGLMLSPTIAGLLVTNYLWLCFLLTGIFIAISTIMIFIFIKNVNKEKDDSTTSIYETEVDNKSNSFKLLLGNKVILLMFIASALSSVVYSTYNFLMPLDLSAQYGESLGSTLFGTISSTNCIVVVLCTALITKIFRKLFDIKKMIIGELLICIGLLIFVTTLRTSIPVFAYIAIVIFTWGEIFNTISSTPFITKRIPASHRGRLMALYNILSGILSSVFQVGIGALYDINKDYGPYLAWGAIGVLGLITILIIVVISFIDIKYFRNLYYGKENPDGHYISVKTMVPNLYQEYYSHYISKDEQYLEAFKVISKEKKSHYLFIMYDATPIGEIIYKNINYKTQTCDVTIEIKEKTLLNQGIGTTATQISIDYALEKFGVSTINAKSDKDNIVYKHLLEKIGFSLKDEQDKNIYYQLSKKSNYA